MEEEVAFDEVLSAMADSLFNLTTQTQIVQIPDKIPIHQLQQIKKPPREIFYKESFKFAPKPPKPILRQICTCRFLCQGDRALIKCLSCALYDPSGVSYYCTNCFNARHPWHRVKHIYTSIHQDELISINMKMQREQIDMDRYMHEGNVLLQNVNKNINKIEYVGDDLKVDNNLRLIGRKMESIDSKLRSIRQTFRNDLIESGATVATTDEDGIAIIQRVSRGYKIRRLISLLYVERIVRVWDASAGRGYYSCINHQSAYSCNRILL
jgi:hypothetical protein